MTDDERRFLLAKSEGLIPADLGWAEWKQRFEFPFQPINEPVRRWRFSVERFHGVFLCGVILPWRRFNLSMYQWEYTAGFGYWTFVLRHEVIGYRAKPR